MIVVGQPSLDAMHVKVVRTFTPRGRARFPWHATSLAAHIERLVTNCTLIIARIPLPYGYCMKRLQRDLHGSTRITEMNGFLPNHDTTSTKLELLDGLDDNCSTVGHNFARCRCNITRDHSRADNGVRVHPGSGLSHSIQCFLSRLLEKGCIMRELPSNNRFEG